MGKIGELSEDVTVRYPIDVSYDMGWQKAKRTYDSLSGQNTTKNAVAFQNFSSTCGFCNRHLKAEAKKAEDNQATNDTTNNIPMPPPTTSVPEHHCPKHYSGSSKGMEAKAALDCVDQV
jgi:hypothetical protein